MFYYVQLPVFGQLGPKTELDSTVHPPVVRKLQCLVDSNPNSDLWRVFPCVVISAALAADLSESACSGFSLADAIFEPGDSFAQFHGSLFRVPELRWCRVNGKAYFDDMGQAEGGKLIVTEKVKRLVELRKHDGVSFFPGDKPPCDEDIRDKVWADAAKAAQELRAKVKPRTGWFAPPKL